MNLPKRKKNRLQHYDYSACGAYFITICTQDKLKTLSNIVGDGSPVPKLTYMGTIVENQIHEIPLKYSNVTIDIFVIMPNHIHFILRINESNGAANAQANGTGNPSPTNGVGNRQPYFTGKPQTSGTGNPSPTVGTIIAWFKYQITKQVNLVNAFPANRVFQRSFHDHVIREKHDYPKILNYIATNPLKWKEDCFYG